MQATETYNGWKNYATWGVALVLDNEEMLAAEIQVTVQDYRDPHNEHPNVAEGIWTQDDSVRFQTEDYVKNLVEELCESDDLNLMQRQVIQAGLAEVDWAEVAAHYLD